MDVNGKKILDVPDDVFVLESKIIDVRNYAIMLSQNVKRHLFANVKIFDI